jgi:hypothetical protein
MPNEQPHVEVLSRNRNSTIVVALVPVTIFSAIVAYSIWPWVWVIPYLIAGILALSVLYGVARGYVDVRRRWFESHIIQASEHGAINMATWQHLGGKPLQLPAPIITEEPNVLSPEDKEIIQRSEVLTMYLDQEKGMHAIADETSIPYQKVRDWCNTAKRLRAKTDQNATREGV